MTSGRPAADDRDVPSEVVGALSWDDLKPLRRLGAVGRLPRGVVSLPFLIAALIVAAWWATSLGTGTTFPNPSWLWSTVWILEGSAFVVTVLLPVALLLRVPDALASQPILFAGLTLGSVVVLVDAVVGLWLLDATGLLEAVNVGHGIGVPLGLALVGLGLVRVRGRRPGRPWLLVAIEALYLGLELLPAGILAIQAQLGQGGIVDIGPDPAGILRALATGFVVWVAVDARLDHAAPAGFWALLAIALPLRIVGGIFQVPQAIAVFVFQGDLGPYFGLPGTVTAVLVVLCAFVAYGRYAPGRDQSAGSSLSAAELMQ